MLAELEIKDFALIEQLRVPFTRGLNVLTGETGAGKSILIDAINAVLGGKVGPSVLRPGADRATIEATFIPAAEVTGWLKQQELLNEDTEELVVSREITKTGSRMRVNGTLVNSASVLELRQKLLSIHAQHEARTLASSQSQLEMLDGLGDANHRKHQEQVRTLYARKRELAAQLKDMQMSEEERLRLHDFARFQLNELEEAALGDPQEDEQIARECRILENVAELENSSAAAQQCLSGNDGDGSPAALDLLQEALSQVERAAQMDGALAPVSESLASCLESVEQSARALRRYRDGLDTDPESLSNLQARLAQLAAVKRKYGPELKDAIAKRTELTEQVANLDNAQAAIEKLEGELSELDSKLGKVVSVLTAARQKLAKKLGEDIQSSLCELGMERCRFEIALEQCEIGPNGADRVDFLISANPGQPLQPVAKIASGGELSRVMLAIKSIFAQADRVATVVFDEIDTGLSGRVLQTMRDKLARLAGSHQILCITHQPIIASVADNHVQVSKKHSAKSTAVHVTILNDGERVQSLAEMASGHANQQDALRFAQSLLDDGNRLRQP